MWGEKFLQVLILLLVQLLGTIYLIFNVTGLFFRFELLLLLVFLFISFLMLFGIYIEEQWSWTLAFIYFALVIVNLIFLKFYLFHNLVIFGVTFLAAFIGFVMAIGHMGRGEPEPLDPESSDPKRPKVEIYETKKLKQKKKKRKKKR